MTSYEKPTHLEVETKEWDVRSDSVASFDTSETLIDDPAFTPGSIFHIHAAGIPVFRLPLPSSELEINVFHNDGSLAYTSTREKRCSGNAILSHPKLGELVSTTYFFGPGRDPEIRLIQSGNTDQPVFKVKGQWTSRSITLTDNEGKAFTWSYTNVKEPSGKKAHVLVLRKKEGKSDGKVLAQLIRGEETRTPGSKPSTAGNGGQLVLDQDAPSAMDESLIIATCLMMLKKEIDRRRSTQYAMLAGAAGS